MQIITQSELPKFLNNSPTRKTALSLESLSSLSNYNSETKKLKAKLKRARQSFDVLQLEKIYASVLPSSKKTALDVTDSTAPNINRVKYEAFASQGKPLPLKKFLPEGGRNSKNRYINKLSDQSNDSDVASSSHQKNQGRQGSQSTSAAKLKVAKIIKPERVGEG